MSQRPLARARPAARAAVAAVCAGLAISCAAAVPGRMPVGRPAGPASGAAAAPVLPSAIRIGGVPFFAQSRYQCGPATLAMALGWSGAEVTPEQLVEAVYLPDRRGSLQASMVSAARRHDRLAYTITTPGDLLAEVAAGHPVIVLQNLGLSWWPAWHYALLIGYDGADRSVLLHTGTHENARLPWKTLLRTWKPDRRWGLVVLAPPGLPATAGHDEALEAIVGLEEASRWRAAAAFYRAAAKRWPRSLTALVGWANSEVALGRPAQAERVLRRAVAEHPRSAAAHNNLAHVLARNGKGVEAVTHARKAVRLGGKTNPVYRKTLEQIERDTGL